MRLLRAALLTFARWAILLALPGIAAAQTELPLWEVGQWSDAEQEYLERINRARSNPSAEGIRLAASIESDVRSALQSFGVDLAMMQAELAALPPAPPLAPSFALRRSAVSHSSDMAGNGFQSHTGTDGSTVLNRAAREGYPIAGIGENVYAYVSSVAFGHAGFEVNWGDTAGATGGMQAGRGHRTTLHQPLFREVGIGVVDALSTAVGPTVVTQNFGVRPDNVRFSTGVVYLDLDGDGFYDAGEGIPGVSLRVAGATYRAETSLAGGWAIPVSSDGTFALTIRDASGSLPGTGVIAPLSITHAGGVNAKADVRIPYLPVVPRAEGDYLRFDRPWTVTGADALVWRTRPTRAADAEVGNDTEVQVETTAGYAVVQSAVVGTGARGYRLSHPDSSAQRLNLTRTFLGGQTPRIRFLSRLAFATVSERARVEVAIEDGPWTEVWGQSGNGAQLESAMSQREVALTGTEGRRFKVRFGFEVQGRTFFKPEFFTGGSALSGWFFDQIEFVECEMLDTVAEQPLGLSTRFRPTVAEAGTYLVALRLQSGARRWPAGPGLRTTLAPAPANPPVWISGETDLGSGWRSSWFGTYQVSRAPWIYHERHGWLYMVPSTGSSWYLYDPSLGWLWTSPSAHPWFYRFNATTWLYYRTGSSSGRYFWNASTRQWSLLPKTQ